MIGNMPKRLTGKNQNFGAIEGPVGALRQPGTNPYREGGHTGRRVLNGAFSRLEPGAGKLARRVLRGVSKNRYPTFIITCYQWEQFFLCLVVFIFDLKKLLVLVIQKY